MDEHSSAGDGWFRLAQSASLPSRSIPSGWPGCGGRAVFLAQPGFELSFLLIMTRFQENQAGSVAVGVACAHGDGPQEDLAKPLP